MTLLLLGLGELLVGALVLIFGIRRKDILVRKLTILLGVCTALHGVWTTLILTPNPDWKSIAASVLLLMTAVIRLLLAFRSRPKK